MFFLGGSLAGLFHKKSPLYELGYEGILKCTCFAYEMHLDFARFHPFWLGLMKSQNLHQVYSSRLTYLHKYLVP